MVFRIELGDYLWEIDKDKHGTPVCTQRLLNTPGAMPYSVAYLNDIPSDVWQEWMKYDTEKSRQKI